MAATVTTGADALERPALPEVERTRMTDTELFEALDPSYSGMDEALKVWKRDGLEAGKAALAGHFRRRTEPKWTIDPHARTARKHRLSRRVAQMAEDAMNHVFRRGGHSSVPGHQFGPDIDWLDNPTYAPEYEFDKEWSMSFLRMPWWEALGEAYWATGDEKYAQEFVAQFLDFIGKHPIPVKRSGSSDHPLKYAAPEWRTLEISIRIKGAWTNSFYRFLTSPSFTDHALCEMLKSEAEMARHLYRFTRIEGRTSNWTTSEVQALFTVGMLFPEFREAAEWKREAKRRMTAELKKQVYPDGVQWELAPGYGSGVLRQFQGVQDLAEMNGETMPARYVKRLEGMYTYFLYSSVDGKCAAFGDSGHGDIRRVMRKGAEVFPGREDFLWMATGGKQGRKPGDLTYAFSYAGQYVMRSGWKDEDRFMIIDAGPYGIAHQHEDNLSFELYAYGDWLVPDPGTYRYNYDSPWRHFMVSSLSHNTLVVDHQGQSRRSQHALYATKRPLRHRFATEGRVTYFRGTYDAGYGEDAGLKVAHTRSIFFVDGRFWVMIDRARPAGKEAHLYESLLMLNRTRATVDGNRIATVGKGPNLLVVAAEQADQTVEVAKGQMEPVRRGWKRGGKTVLPNPTAVVGKQCKEGATFAMLLYPVAPGKNTPPAKIAFLPVTGGRDAVAVQITVPGKKRMTLVDQLGRGQARVGGRAVRGEMAWLD